MDFIDKGIQQLNGHIETEACSWSDFHHACEGRQIYVYGMGHGAEFLFGCGEPLDEMAGFLDGNKFYVGKNAEAIIPMLLGTSIGVIKVSSPELLDRIDPDMTVILITTTKFVKEILDTLISKGFKHNYSLMEMEADLRKKGEYRTGKEKELETFAEQCLQIPIDEKKIVFQSTGKYADHGKYITEQLLKMDSDLDIVWMVDDKDSEVPQGVRISNINDEKSYIYEFETAHIWVAATPLRTLLLKKREGQKYIQTKHWGSVTLKRFYLDSMTLDSFSRNVWNWKEDFSKIDHIITGSEFDTESSRRGFAFEGDVLNVGSPRSDAMFRRDEIGKRIRSKYGIKQDDRIILYAPTYRYIRRNGDIQEQQTIQGFGLDYLEVKKALESSLGGNWIIMIRLHPSVAFMSENNNVPGFCVDVSRHSDGEELCAACNAMITDYSSIMFEPMYAGLPVFLYAPDRREYIDKEYDLLIEYDALPFPIAESMKELVDNIVWFDNERYRESIGEFMEKYNVHEDGHASERAAKEFLKLINCND